MVGDRASVPALLQKLRLNHGDVQVESTPRRLAVIVKDLAASQQDVEDRVRGPPVKVCPLWPASSYFYLFFFSFFACLSVCLCVCLSVCLFVCLPVCLFICFLCL
jgi:Glycyl-tRNA synthetase beta subunit